MSVSLVPTQTLMLKSYPKSNKMCLSDFLYSKEMIIPGIFGISFSTQNISQYIFLCHR